MKQKYRRGRSQKRPSRQRKKNIFPIALVVAGVLLLVAAGFWYSSNDQQVVEAALAYEPDDVVYGAPIFAIHEMEAGPPIPFLPRSGPQPDIMVPETLYDFGSIGPTEVVERTFIVRNVGDAPLTISRAYTTCGCTTAEISASVIPPGKVATVKMVFDAGYHDTRGQTVRRGLIIETNDPAQSEAEIWLVAAVRSS